MLWYTLERYVHCLVGQSFIRIPSDDDDDEHSEWKPMPCKKLVEDVCHHHCRYIRGIYERLGNAITRYVGNFLLYI